MRNVKTGEEIEYWFYSTDERDRFILYRAKEEYEIVSFLGDQIELEFDLRE